MPSASQFSLAHISVQNRPLVDDDNRPLANPDGSVAGDVPPGSGVLVHWLDSSMYDAWVAEAYSKITAAIRDHNPAYMQLASKAAMKAYNAANVPWWIDPVARKLYRIWISGRPRSVGGNTLTADFGAGPGSIYNNSVFLAPDDRRCIIVGGTGLLGTVHSYGGCNSDNGHNNPDASTPIVQFDGVIPRNARSFYNSFAPGGRTVAQAPIQYLPRLQFLVRVPDDRTMLPRQYWTTSDPSVPLPFDLGLLKSDVLFNDVIWRTDSKQFYRKPDGSDASHDPDGWDTWAFDANGVMGTPQQVRPSYAAYAQYLSSLVDGLKSRTAWQVVQDARTYALYRNARAQQAAGGTFAALAGGAVQNLNALQSSDPAAQAGLRATAAVVATAAAAVGVALAVPTAGIAAGVGALIGGAASAFAQIASQVVPPDLSNVWIDDLERPKPWIERSWLGGDPSDSSMGPPLQIDAPPGWTRPAIQARGLNLANLKHRNAGTDTTSLSDTSSPFAAISSAMATVPTWVWIVGGLVIGGGALYAGSRLTQGAKRGASRRSRGSSRRSTRRSHR